jgi:RNA polymerase sigma-70 factor (ECF subfamily)
MCSSRVLGEDMVQSALSKAWASRASYQLGTNLRAWLFTILRNEISSHRRRAWRETHWDKAAVERMPSVPDEHQAAVDLSDIERALRSLPETQREGLILVGAGGVSYEDSAAICNVAVETVKSRVARGRAALIEILDGTDRRPLTTRAVPDRAMVDILAHLGALTRSGPAQATAFPA